MTEAFDRSAEGVDGLTDASFRSAKAFDWLTKVLGRLSGFRSTGKGTGRALGDPGGDLRAAGSAGSGLEFTSRGLEYTSRGLESARRRLSRSAPRVGGTLVTSARISTAPPAMRMAATQQIRLPPVIPNNGRLATNGGWPDTVAMATVASCWGCALKRPAT
eukprot:281424-Prorocentrum_minimum.AAC.1